MNFWGPSGDELCVLLIYIFIFTFIDEFFFFFLNEETNVNWSNIAMLAPNAPWSSDWCWLMLQCLTRGLCFCSTASIPRRPLPLTDPITTSLWMRMLHSYIYIINVDIHPSTHPHISKLYPHARDIVCHCLLACKSSVCHVAKFSSFLFSSFYYIYTLKDTKLFIPLFLYPVCNKEHNHSIDRKFYLFIYFK